MITESFDNSKPIITPELFLGKVTNLCDTCIATFSDKILKHVLEDYKCEIIGRNDQTVFYLFEEKGKKYCVYLSRMSAPTAANDLIAAHQFTGAENFITFGSAGSLNQNLTNGKYVVPTKAYRDEGLSYHYAPASDYIEVKNHKILSDLFNKLGLPYQEGLIWTTDALFMETQKQFELRKAEGCIAVEMEVSGLQAVCDYYGYNYYCFLETGDVLSTVNYDKSGLNRANHSLHKFDIALELAKSLS